MEKLQFELTNPQKSIWYTNQMYSNVPIENICGSVFVEEKTDFEALERAINLFVEKNDSFRIKLINNKKMAQQYISDFVPFKVEKIKLKDEGEVSKLERKLVSKVFPIFETLLFEFKMFEFPNGQGGFTINAHHLISDAWTAGLVVNEIMEYYEKIIKGEEVSKSLNPSYVDYINTENEYLNSKKFEDDKKFWDESFRDIPEVATIPSLNCKKEIQMDCTSKRKLFTIPKETMDLINDYCKSKKASAFNFFMSVIAIYISRVSGMDEFVIGTPILNRSNFKEKQTTGMYISTIPFKISLNSDELFVDILSKIATDFSKIYRHQKYPYQYLLNDLRSKDNNIPNFYKIIMSYQNVRSNKQTANIKYSSRWVDNNNISDDIDIHLYDMNDTGSINMAYDYLVNKYTENDICSIHDRLFYIINQILENDKIQLKDIEIVTKKEQYKILDALDKTDVNYPKNKTIAQLFEEQVEKTPNNIAVKINDAVITYSELNKRANQLANYLVGKGILKNDIVALRSERKIEMIVAILGIIKAGAGYLPINLAYPEDRVNFMVSDSKAKILLCDNSTKDDMQIDLEHIIIDFDNEEIYKGKDEFVKLKTYPDDLLYIIYTSGSTGTPKGAMISNKNVVRLMKNDKYLFDFSEKDVWTMFHSVAFDFSVWEMYGALLYGGKLILVPEETAKDPRLFLDLLRKEKVTVLNQTPTYFYNLLNTEMQFEDENLKIRYIIYGGEALKPSAIQRWKEKYPQTKLINMYGITETTVHVTYKELTPQNLKLNNSNIGVPIPTLKILLLDKNLKMVPYGVPGEICVAGDGVFKGYLNRPDLNDIKIIPNPYNNSEMIYRSGDSAILNENLELEYIGRIDTQVKIRGFRVELGEIEEKILEIPNIKSCVVTTKSIDKVHELLCAYYVKSGDVKKSSIRNILREKLPNYMVPQYFIELDILPVNHNGKIDKKALPNPEVSTEKEIVQPRNNIDEKLIDIFRKLLNVANISIEDSFFELGGDSLSAINLCEEISKEFNVQIFVKDILKNSVIMELSDYISLKNGEISETKIKKACKQQYYPVSVEQKGIYYSVKKASKENLIYNVSGAIIANTLLDADKIKNVMLKLIEMHSSFRTRFIINNDELLQEVLAFEDIKKDIKVNVFNESEKNINKIINDFPKPFDLEKAPLLRFDICFLDNQKTLILLDTHHIIMDGVSLNILISDFCKLYNDEQIEKLEFNYIDYSVWENEYINGDLIKEYDKYWSKVFPNADIPTLNLPYDYPATSIKKYEGDRISFNMESDEFKKLQAIAKINNITEYTLFISALYVLLYKYTSQTDLIVASPNANRNIKEFQNIIGMFANNIVLRENIDTGSSISKLLKDTQNTVNDVLENQPYPYELIAKKVNNNSSLLDVVLTYQNIRNTYEKIDNVDLELISANTKTAKFNIWIEIIPSTYTFNIEYNTNLFKKETIQSFLDHYIFILKQFINSTDTNVDDIEFLTRKEIKLLEKFNDTNAPINDDTVVSIFEEQVRKHPNDIALICEDKTLTYKELNKKANSLAHYLIKKGVGRNDIVCIMTNRSFETIVCMMAILKAGAAFFNVDPTYPIERTKYYLEDSKTRYVLTQTELKSRVQEIENCIEIDLDISKIYSKNFSNPDVKVKKNDLSYLIYTSGSTGKPKGTMLNQVGFANMTKAMTNVLDYLKEGNKHCIASVTSTPFDIFVYEIIVSLTHGLKIAMADNAEHRNPKLLDALIKRCNVDVMTVTPSLMKINYDNREQDSALSRVKNMVFGGEPLPEKFVKDLKALANDITIYNIYGPSEITILSNVQNLDGETEITVGKPIMNTQIHILDKNMKRVPIGVVGEIYISGIQVGLRLYWKTRVNS